MDNSSSQIEVQKKKTTAGRYDTYSPQQVIDALRQAKGFTYVASSILGCCDKTIYNYRKKFPEVEAALQEIIGLTHDGVEIKILEQIEEGNDKVMMFYARTKMKHRGYQEGIKIEKTVESIARAVESLSDEDLDLLSDKLSERQNKDEEFEDEYEEVYIEE